MEASNKVVAIALIGIMSLAAFKNPSQESELLKNIVSKLLLYNQRRGPEKTYLQTDKDFYTNGETIWFKTYLVDGITHRASNKSRVVYVDLVDANDSIHAQRKLFVDHLGASGDIALIDKIPQGEYRIRAYTKYMLNGDTPLLFEKKVPIFYQEVGSDITDSDSPQTGSLSGLEEAKENVDGRSGQPILRFFPEGGHLVEGLPTTVGVEVTNNLGNGVSLKGTIKDQNGDPVTHFETLEFGLGSVNFIPKPGNRYYASIPFKSEELNFPVPEPVPSGYVLSVKNRVDDILVQVASSADKNLMGTILIGHLRGKLILKRIGKLNDKNAYGVRLLTSELDDGVAHFTLFAPDGEPLCERLAFVTNPTRNVALSISSDSKNYGLREKVSLDLTLKDENGRPLQGDLSMGVVTESGTLANSSLDIKSWLLLNSDIGGTISNPDYFFHDTSNERRFLLDALMLTHGWRRFVWKDFLESEAQPKYAPEKGIMITGRITGFKEPEIPKKSKVTLNILSTKMIQDENVTDGQGTFAFGPYNFTDSLDIVVQAIDTTAKRKAKQNKLSISLSPLVPKVTVKGPVHQNKNVQTVRLVQNYLKESRRKKMADFQFDPREVRLDEVVVTKNKKSRNQRITEEFGAERTSGLFSKRVFTDSLPGAKYHRAMDILRRIPGVIVTGQYPDEKVRIVTLGEPMFLIDGLRVDIARVQDMMADEVMFIDVVKGIDVVEFGLQGYTGVIAIYRNRSLPADITMTKEYPGVTNFKIPGFYKTREFYTPNYAENKKEFEKPDYRTTLLWEPDVTISNDGLSSVDFYTGDKAGRYIVKVEGLTDDGRPVSGLHTIEVRESN